MEIITFDPEIATKYSILTASLYSILQSKVKWNKSTFIDLRQVVREYPFFSYRTARRCMANLRKGNYLKVLSNNEKVKLLKNNYVTGSIGDEVCEWCKSRTITLEEHHYPVPKSKGARIQLKFVLIAIRHSIIAC